MKRIILLGILLGLLSSHCIYALKEGVPEEYSQLISSYVTNFNNKDFLATAKLFHYPNNYSDRELERDTYCLSKFLEYFNQEFGDINEIIPVKNGDKYYSVELYGGDKRYWQKHSQYTQFEYLVDFSKEGRGYLIFWLCNISGKVEIRSVRHAISASKENAKTRMYEQIIKGMDDVNNKLKMINEEKN
jgi:hypothetical protein